MRNLFHPAKLLVVSRQLVTRPLPEEAIVTSSRIVECQSACFFFVGKVRIPSLRSLAFTDIIFQNTKGTISCPSFPVQAMSAVELDNPTHEAEAEVKGNSELEVDSGAPVSAR